MAGFLFSRASSSTLLLSADLFSARSAFLTEIKSQRREKPIGLRDSIALPSSNRICGSRNFSLRKSRGKLSRFFQAGISSRRVVSFKVQRRIERRVLVIAYAA